MNNQLDIFSRSIQLEDEENKIKALDDLFEKSAQYKQSREFKNLLDFINKFPNLSPFNAFLIHMQDSGAQIVLTHSKWLEYGRRIKPNARPLIILIPFGPVSFVYNISDTELIEEGKDHTPESLLDPFKTKGDFNYTVYQKTVKNASLEGISIDEDAMHSDSAGYVTWKSEDTFSIKLNSNLKMNEKFSTLIHELAHVYCGHLGVHKNSWWESRSNNANNTREIEAESVSYLVCSRVGLNTTSSEYLSLYISQNKAMPNISLDTILKVANHIEKMGQPNFKPKKK